MIRNFTRRTSIMLLLSLCFASSTLAQQAKTIKMVVPFPAGGTADIFPRMLAEKMRTDYPAGIIVENRAGAGGNIGADIVFRADADGTTFLASPPGPIAINHNLYSKLSFEPTKWEPVTVIATVPNVLAVRNKFPAQNLNEFIAYLKANPGRVSYASQGNGSTSHLTASLFMQLTGTVMTHIPYKGTAPALNDIIGGQVDVFFDNLSSSMPFHQSGKLRILAVADEKRSPALAQVPTFAESKLPAMIAVTWFAVVAPPNTPAGITGAFQKSMAVALSLPDVRQKISEQGAEPRGWSTEQTGIFIRAETEKWNTVIKSANVKLE
jgi:tripartite-type tricarboxylate transporter receptor subunit TctC